MSIDRTRPGFQGRMDGFATAAAADRHAESRARLDALATLLDSAVRIPGTSIRVGADAALNLIPGVGTVFAKGLAAFIVWEARRMGAPLSMQARMVANVGIDTVISAIPVIGWAGDVFFRANSRNIDLLRRHLDSSASQTF